LRPREDVPPILKGKRGIILTKEKRRKKKTVLMVRNGKGGKKGERSGKKRTDLPYEQREQMI